SRSLHSPPHTLHRPAVLRRQQVCLDSSCGALRGGLSMEQEEARWTADRRKWGPGGRASSKPLRYLVRHASGP
ncbi:unnamed protein product, partial [Ectocarpus sp. 6 AP-2014]